MKKTTLFAASLLAALAGLAQAQPAEPGSPPTAPAPVPMPPPAEDDAGDEPADVTGADDPGVDERPGETLAPAPGEKRKKNKDKDKAKAADDAGDAAEPPEIEVSGRVFARATAFDEEFNPWIAGMTLDSARFQLNYRWKNRLAAEVSAEIRARGAIRDAYLDLMATDCLEVRAGRFKLPASAVERTSTWTLPTIDRPLTSTILDAGMGLSGRRNGAMLVWKPRLALQPRLEVSLGQSMDIVGEEQPRIVSDYAGITATVRGEVRPHARDDGSDVRVGAFAQSRDFGYEVDGAGIVTAIDRFWAGGADLEADLPALGLRLWADVMAGSAHFGLESGDEASTFAAAHAVAGWRMGGADRGKQFVELFGSAAYFNPDVGSDPDDALMEGKLGVGAGRWKRWRAQLQLALVSAPPLDRAIDDLGGFEVSYADRTTVSLQVGAAF